eukprot:gene35-2936_t
MAFFVSVLGNIQHTKTSARKMALTNGIDDALTGRKYSK